LWLPDSVITLSLKSLTHVHSQLLSSKCSHIVNMDLVSCCDWLAGFPFIFPTSSLLNTWSHLATVRYGRACSPKASCNPLWHCDAFHLCAIWILMKQRCSYRICFWSTWYWHIMIDITKGHLKQIHANRMTRAARVIHYAKDHKKHCSAPVLPLIFRWPFYVRKKNHIFI
jgi:hypothetical protein